MGGLAFTFLTPLMLFSALLAPLLVLAYRRNRPSKRSIVSSAMLLKNLQHRRPTRQRIKLPFRFFLELLALLLLAAAAAIPVLRSPAENIAIVVDNSFSMAAPSGDPLALESRLALAKEEAVDLIDSAPSGSTFSVYVTSPHLTDLAAGPVDAAAARTLVAAAAVSPTPDQLRAAIIGLGSSGQYDRVAVFTDHEALSGEHLHPGSDPENKVNISLSHVGKPVPNLFLGELRSTDGPDGERTIIVPVNSAADRRAAAVVQLSIEGKKAAALAEQTAELDPQQTVELRFDLPRLAENGAVIRAELSSPQGAAVDSLPADNTAYLAGAGSRTNRVLLVSADPTAADPSFGLTLIPSLQVTTLGPEAAAQLAPEELKTFALLIFHRVSLAAALPVPSLFILPPAGAGIFSSEPGSGSGAVTSWSEDHPITSYLRVALLNLPAFSLINVPSWSGSVINVERGSVLAAGESRGIRFAAAGFELLPYEGAKTPLTTIITLNLIKWLSGTKELAGSLLVGSSHQLEGDRSWVVRLPDGKLQKFVTTESESKELNFPAAGVYTVAGVATDSSAKVSKTVNRFVVNIRFPEESATDKSTPLEIPSDFNRLHGNDSPGIELWKPLLWTVIFLLLLETILFFLPRPVEA